MKPLEINSLETHAFVTRSPRKSMARAFVLGAWIAASALSTFAIAQNFDIEEGPVGSVAAQDGGTHGPLVLKQQGMFYVGGDIVHTDWAGGANPLHPSPRSGDIMINQMYVTFMVPKVQSGVPIILVHGGTLSGACYETTPDGRMGWYEYFARKGHAAYLPDQVSRARSGFNVTAFNEVADGANPISTLPYMFVVTKEHAWENFRFGPSPATAFADEQFPVDAINELAKQEIPDQNSQYQKSPGTNFTLTRLSELAEKVGGAVLLGHSESGFYPELTALGNSESLRALISLEPTGCSAKTLSQEQIATLARIPTLVVFGDHIADVPASFTNWPAALADCKLYVAEINQAGGDATMLHLQEAGVFGNSHMLFQDRNNLQVGDMILSWISEHVQ